MTPLFPGGQFFFLAIGHFCRDRLLGSRAQPCRMPTAPCFACTQALSPRAHGLIVGEVYRDRETVKVCHEREFFVSRERILCRGREFSIAIELFCHACTSARYAPRACRRTPTRALLSIVFGSVTSARTPSCEQDCLVARAGPSRSHQEPCHRAGGSVATGNQNSLSRKEP